MNLLSYHESGLVAAVTGRPGSDELYAQFFAVPDASQNATSAVTITKDNQRREQQFLASRFPLRPFDYWLSGQEHLDYFVSDADSRGLDVLQVPHGSLTSVSDALDRYRQRLPAGEVSEDVLERRIAQIGFSYPTRKLSSYLRQDLSEVVEEISSWAARGHPKNQQRRVDDLARLATHPSLALGSALSAYSQLGLDAGRLRAYTELSQQLAGQDNLIDAGLARSYLKQELTQEMNREFFPEL